MRWSLACNKLNRLRAQRWTIWSLANIMHIALVMPNIKWNLFQMGGTAQTRLQTTSLKMLLHSVEPKINLEASFLSPNLTRGKKLKKKLLRKGRKNVMPPKVEIQRQEKWATKSTTCLSSQLLHQARKLIEKRSQGRLCSNITGAVNLLRPSDPVCLSVTVAH